MAGRSPPPAHSDTLLLPAGRLTPSGRRLSGALFLAGSCAAATALCLLSPAYIQFTNAHRVSSTARTSAGKALPQRSEHPAATPPSRPATPLSAFSVSGDSVSMPRRPAPAGNGNPLPGIILGALGLLSMAGAAVVELLRCCQTTAVYQDTPAANELAAVLGPVEFETVVPGGVRGVPGVYYAPGAELGRAVLRAVPSLATKADWYQPPPWALNGHIHTIVASTSRRTPAVSYNRTLLRCPTGGTVALDLLMDAHEDRVRGAEDAVTYVDEPSAQWLEQNRHKPFLLMVSGLGGGSHDAYLRSMAAHASSKGWQVGVVNMRGCGGSPLTSPRFFSAHRGSTEDVRLALAHIRQHWVAPGGKVAAVGWSNGATIINNFLAEQEQEFPDPSLRVDAAATLACPLNMEIANRNLKKWFNRHIYDRSITQNLVSLLAPHLHMFEGKDIDTWDGGKCNIDTEELMRSSTIEEIDHSLTRKVFGFPTVEAYYASASSHQRLTHIRVPTLIMNALDDPVAPGEAIAYEEVRANPNLLLVVTEHGGHLGWCERSAPTEGSAWVESVCLDYLRVVLGLPHKEAE